MFPRFQTTGSLRGVARRCVASSVVVVAPPLSATTSSSSLQNHHHHRKRFFVHRIITGQPQQQPSFHTTIRFQSTQSAADESSEPVETETDDSSSSAVISSSEEQRSDSRSIVSKEEIHQEEQQRGRLSDVKISEILKAKHSHRWVDPVIARTATVKDAIVTAIDGGLSGMMVIDDVVVDDVHDQTDTVTSRKVVVGLVTSRDLLRITASGFKEGDQSADAIMNQTIGDFMTPISQVIYGRPDETVGMIRTIMAKLGIKTVPILSKDGRVEGVVTAKDFSDFGISAREKGGKKSYLSDVSERVGLKSNTSMAEPPSYLQAHLALEQTPLFVNVAVSEMPHPYKTEDSVGMNQRDHGPRAPASNADLSEDAYFVYNSLFPDEKDPSIERHTTYFGVADGVGSWREYGVDPRDFSHKLMAECENILAEAAAHNTNSGSGDDDKTKSFRRMIAPSEILAQAYQRTKDANVIGSCTACIALFDTIRHQLHFSNLGDSGIIVLRHIDSDVAGSLKRDKEKPRHERTSDLRVAFVSQQQLKSFNHPFQLGWTGEEVEGEETSLKSPRDSCTTSIHIRRGDIIIMATDGLFDNVDVDDVAQIALEWEQKNGFIRGGDIAAREQRWLMGNSLTVLSSERVQSLSDALCERAREASLDQTKDSPFAILAKENDIMWSGGMPDDCTVVVAHVVGRAADDTMDKDNQ